MRGGGGAARGSFAEYAILFSVFINDLALELKDAGVGVHINFKNYVFNNENVTNSDTEFIICTLLYADDIICLAETEEDLQILIDIYINKTERPFVSHNFTCSLVFFIAP